MIRVLEFLRPYRIIVVRRVTDEEQVTVEAYARTPADAEARLASFLAVCADHKRQYNQKVILAHNEQALIAESRLQRVAAQIEEADETLATRQTELAKLDQILKAKRERAGMAAV